MVIFETVQGSFAVAGLPSPLLVMAAVMEATPRLLCFREWSFWKSEQSLSILWVFVKANSAASSISFADELKFFLK